MTKKQTKTERKDALTKLGRFERTDYENTIAVLRDLCGDTATLAEIANRLSGIRKAECAANAAKHITININI